MTLKIQILTKGKAVVFTLIGRINAEEVAEMQRLFEAEGQDCRIVLDLQEVELVDREHGEISGSLQRKWRPS